MGYMDYTSDPESPVSKEANEANLPTFECSICYKDTMTCTPCCSQGICNECATNWVQKWKVPNDWHDSDDTERPTPTCPCCRTSYVSNLHDLSCDKLVEFHITSGGRGIKTTSCIIGTIIKFCKQIIKVKSDDSIKHIKICDIIEYKIHNTPNIYMCKLRFKDFNEPYRATFYPTLVYPLDYSKSQNLTEMFLNELENVMTIVIDNNVNITNYNILQLENHINNIIYERRYLH